ncbi:MAG: 50S ribosomal protein L15, large subunit ribosomal protein L15 [candidate division WS6 bacterium GW2011_GWC1_33_20]|uniref:Large ribosomal subunit protein uL15 n=2 Tax=Candidatus Dojkabacteria TaxID=74243 RepID=A0A0G0ATA5_9BACT|nr:ribosomal protein L15 [uncultured bacterium]KKP42865.1 MAG: 50S ribosomal protein L15, large subunit ribosomal protein L15 [candidate division WS6 bacterium GW2011_GWE2_33_157]KKP44549.1 MAG: 50S ribosomal protein L15, large subunit ribosomal protein L15 [candidate division WS6 bacterium GW2011_GWC1_33_20]KKP46141.1 MAG: 50S ribosomal protein L15, large subunit ribosomal protein L15 [candidate division WS6 bacterium GW2011_GWF1_33_233]KKP54646.1 MAG: 50S ribosomal protein L15 [candidate divi
MNLDNIPKRNNRESKSKRLGRGYGSGVGGHTSTRGSKGQKSRAGHKSLVFFEGGNVPFFRRMPKYKGFNKSDKVRATAINLNILEENFKSGESVTLEILKEKALVSKSTTVVKILGLGELTKKIVISGIPASESAIEKVIKAGGSIK